MSGADDELPECWLRALSDNGWRYKGEGNANVVLAVPAYGTVLRVMKEGGGGTADTVFVRARYCDAVRRAFMGRHADVPVPVRVSAEQLHQVDRGLRALTGCRLPDRLSRGVACAAGLVAVCPDYTVLRGAGPVHCVEIKPKQGWLHVADRRDHAGKCRFCAHQYLKLCRGDVPYVSRYCPLDLFSGRRDRVRRAVRQLLRTPQNNLKMFLDGVPLDDNRDGGGGFARAASAAFGDEHRFCEFVAAALLGDFANVEYVSQDHREPLSGCEFDATAPMSPDCVLHKILTMQKMQTTGFAAVCSAYDRSPRSSAAAAQFGHVDRLVQAASAGAVVLDLLDGYLVAATAHDCSVFVTFSGAQMPGGDLVEQQRDVAVVRFGAGWYAVRVKVSDLDPKPLSTVDKHRKRDADALLACERYSGRGCPPSSS